MDWPDPHDAILPWTQGHEELIFSKKDDPLTVCEYSNKVYYGKGDAPFPGMIELQNEVKWKQWFQSEQFREAKNAVEASNTTGNQSGYQVVLCGRARSVNDGKEGPNNWLAFSHENWKELVRAFPIGKSILKVIKPEPFTASNPYDSAFLEHVSTTTTTGRKQKMHMFTARSPIRFGKSITISSTHFVDSGFTTAVIYGCTADDCTRVSDLLRKNSTEAKDNPLLMIGMFIQMQYDRLKRILAEVKTRSEKAKKKFDTYLFDDSTTSITRKDIQDLLKSRIELIQLEEEITATKGMAEKVLSLVPDLNCDREDRGWDKRRKAHYKERLIRFEQRIRGICLHHDKLISDCKFIVEDISSTRENFLLESSRQEAETSRQETLASKQQAKYSLGIAMAALIYLPGPSIATVMAMPIFDWDAVWRDLRFKVIPKPSESESGDAPVVSGYIWIWLGATIALTILTPILCWSYVEWAPSWLKPAWVRRLVHFHERKPSLHTGKKRWKSGHKSKVRRRDNDGAGGGLTFEKHTKPNHPEFRPPTSSTTAWIAASSGTTSRTPSPAGSSRSTQPLIRPSGPRHGNGITHSSTTPAVPMGYASHTSAGHMPHNRPPRSSTLPVGGPSPPTSTNIGVQQPAQPERTFKNSTALPRRIQEDPSPPPASSHSSTSAAILSQARYAGQTQDMRRQQQWAGVPGPRITKTPTYGGSGGSSSRAAVPPPRSNTMAGTQYIEGGSRYGHGGQNLNAF